MTVNAMVLGQRNRFGLVAMRSIAAGLFALLMLTLLAEAADAKPSPGSYQNGFTAACRNHGGTPKRVTTRVVKCTLADGTTITCDFNVDPPACVTKPAAFTGAGGGYAVPFGDSVLEPAQPEASVSDTRVEAVRATSGVIFFVQDDEEP